MTSHHLRRVALAAASSLLLVTAACGSDSDSSEFSGQPVDDGTSLTMWVRAATGDYSQRLVDAYNDSHDNEVTLTVIPNDQYLQRVGAAAGSNSLPDILVSDVVNSPNYTTKGLLRDITDQVEALPYADRLAQAHIRAATDDGEVYAVPHKVDSSVLYYNKDLFAQAGLDPEAGPTTFDELYHAAKAVAGLGGDVSGFYFAGNCGGCTGYTTFPVAWAAGHDVISDDGQSVDIDNDAFKETFALYGRMYDEGIVVSGAKTDDGATWTAGFLAGNVGILLMGSQLINSLQDVDFDWGVEPLGSPNGAATSTFVGGDVAGISTSSEHADQAWDFLTWTLDEDAQVDVVSKNGDLPVRDDLSDNEYTSADPRRQMIAENLPNGRTPSTLPYGELFNDANGPWVAGFRGAIFGDDPDAALADAQASIQEKLDSTY
ncbi:ABC transporter substrate-binding protein [Streptomyces sp. 6N223]|uniref:ABC transporter substrate-binding protein n=1 Tax=Streptomyces sp. 6N223 TaxID=3457412 RepID=UPI003FD34878